jgi:N-acetyl-anhydromuramyl-L-alanine amidase AmpD
MSVIESFIIDKSLRLPSDRYINEETSKKAVCLHHTVGGSARSTFEWWKQNPSRVCTAYIVERNGVIYEVFDPQFAAWHLGGASALGVVYKEAKRYNYETIGIELASEGALRSGYELNAELINIGLPPRFDENYLYAFDIDPNPNVPEVRWFTGAKKLYHKNQDINSYVDFGEYWRRYRYFDAYDEPQVQATFWLVNKLCDDFNIPKRIIDINWGGYDKNILDFKGTYTHCNVRRDKSDVHPRFDWQGLRKYLEIRTFHKAGTL